MIYFPRETLKNSLMFSAKKKIYCLPFPCRREKYGYFSISSVHLVVKCRAAQSVTCLATDACLIADHGVASSIPVRSHTFVEIDYEMISTDILLPSAESFKKG